jgi:hypothetical protein
MSLFSQFATDRRAELEGIEVRFGAKNEDGTEPIFRIARMGTANKRYKKMLEQETKPHIHAIRNETLSAALDEAITMRLFCTTVLLDWRDVIVPEVFGDNERAPFSPENAEKLMRALPELYSTLREQAAKMSTFRTAEIEADSKN